MNIIKKYTFSFLYMILSIIITLLLLTALYHFDIISSNIYHLLKLIMILLILLLTGISLGKKATNRGYLEGVKLGTFTIILFTLLTLLTSQDLKLKLLLYDLIILITAVLGGMIGINKKKD